jgi:hypothetical protein
MPEFRLRNWSTSKTASLGRAVIAVRPYFHSPQPINHAGVLPSPPWLFWGPLVVLIGRLPSKRALSGGNASSLSPPPPFDAGQATGSRLMRRRFPNGCRSRLRQSPMLARYLLGRCTHQSVVGRKAGHTPGNVKLLLPSRQSRGNSQCISGLCAYGVQYTVVVLGGVYGVPGGTIHTTLVTASSCHGVARAIAGPAPHTMC